MVSQNQFCNVMVTQDFYLFKNKWVKKCHCLLRSVLRTVINLKVLLRGFTRRCMVRSEPSESVLQIISTSMQIIWMQRLCRGSLNMRLFRSIVSWSDRMEIPHLRRYSRSLRGHQSFTLGSVFWVTFSLNPQLKSCRFVLHLKSHLDFG